MCIVTNVAIRAASLTVFTKDAADSGSFPGAGPDPCTSFQSRLSITDDSPVTLAMMLSLNLASTSRCATSQVCI